MAQYSFIKSAGGVLIPAIPDARAFINSKVKLGLFYMLISGELVNAAARSLDYTA
nr:hypothetical protein [Kluyvera intermedia]